MAQKSGRFRARMLQIRIWDDSNQDLPLLWNFTGRRPRFLRQTNRRMRFTARYQVRRRRHTRHFFEHPVKRRFIGKTAFQPNGLYGKMPETSIEQQPVQRGSAEDERE